MSPATLFSLLHPSISVAACPQALLGGGEGIQALSLLQQQQPGSIGRKQLQSSHELVISHSVMSEEVEETETTELTNYFHSLKQDVKRDLRNLDFQIKSKYKLTCIS